MIALGALAGALTLAGAAAAIIALIWWRALPEAPLDGRAALLAPPDSAIEAAEMIVIAFPGALNSVDLFGPDEAWASYGVALARYRLPGLDGLALDHKLTIKAAAREARALTLRFPEKRIGFIGFSIGARLALETALAVSDRRPRIVLLNPTMDLSATLGAARRSAAHVIALAWRRGALDGGALWRSYYRVLLFGPSVDRDPELADRADAITAARAKTGAIRNPGAGILLAQTGDVMGRALELQSPEAYGPILLMHGAEDPVTPLDAVRRLADRLSTRLEIVEGVGHLTPIAAPEALDRARAFLIAEE